MCGSVPGMAEGALRYSGGIEQTLEYELLGTHRIQLGGDCAAVQFEWRQPVLPRDDAGLQTVYVRFHSGLLPGGV
ncbi:hypothetical protein D3C73_1385810 [compost metagenome]